MAATFMMSFGGVDFRLSPTNRQAGISFQPSASTEEDLIVLRLDSFTGTLQIRSSNVTAVSPRSDDSSSSVGHHDECSKPTNSTTTFTTTGVEQANVAAAAPANVTPKMSPRRPRSDSTTGARSNHDTTTAALTTTASTDSPTLAEPTAVFSPTMAESARGKSTRTENEWQPEHANLATNHTTTTTLTGKRPQASDSSSSSASTDERAPQSKRSRQKRPKPSIAALIEKHRLKLQSSSTTTSATSSVDESTSHRNMVFLGQTPDFSQPSICEELLESACSGCDDLPLMFDDPAATSTPAQHAPTLAGGTQRATSPTVKELLNQACNSVNSFKGHDDDDDDDDDDDEGEKEDEVVDNVVQEEDEDTKTVDCAEQTESNPEMETEAIKVVEEEAEFVGWYNGEESFLRRPTSAGPLPRWGQTMTKIGENQILLYGGQAFESAAFPTTLSDVHVYDLAQRAWHQPVNCDGVPRQWHSATYLPKRQLLISFGGESADPTTKKITTTDQVMVLDTEIMLWYPPTVTGTAPSGRSGHTAALFNNGNDLVVFGGVKGAKWLNSVSVLDTMRWRWSSPKIAGSAPKPRSYHSATAICRGKKNRLVIFGGNNADSSFDGVHVLENEDKAWRWFHPTIRGTGPAPRTGHTATLLEDNKTILIYGGWDVNLSDEDTIFGDSFLLDTETWVWRPGPQLCFPVASDATAYEREGEKRVGHSAVLVHGQEGAEVLVFGGRIPNDKFCNDFQRISLQQHVLGAED